jgi:hypothetical protein
MEKYLFNDGTNEIREVQSREELEVLIQSAIDREKIRIWVFNSNEWLTHAEFSKRGIPRTPVKKKNITPVPAQSKQVSPVPAKKRHWVRNITITAIATATALVIYNFTRITWKELTPLTLTASRPENTPPVDVDSLIQALEIARNAKLDKVTRTNLRIRTTWPERILLNLTSQRQTNGSTTKFHDVNISVDNATGYFIDDAVVKLQSWKNNQVVTTDTFHFKTIAYSMPAQRLLTQEYRGDSLSISFSSIKAKPFNFCYSADKESNYGNLNDRWFCK